MRPYCATIGHPNVHRFAKDIFKLRQELEVSDIFELVRIFQQLIYTLSKTLFQTRISLTSYYGGMHIEDFITNVLEKERAVPLGFRDLQVVIPNPMRVIISI